MSKLTDYALISAADAWQVKQTFPSIQFYSPKTGKRVKPHREHSTPSGGSHTPNKAHWEHLREDEQ